MKAKPLQFNALTQQIKTQYKGCVVFGTDIAHIQDLSNKIKNLILTEGNDFSLLIYTANQLKNTPFLITDEANTPNLMGARRLIWVKEGQNLPLESLQNFCEHSQTDAFLLITCDNLPKNHALRLEAESNPSFLTFACYPPEKNELSFLIQQFTKQHNFTITTEAVEYLIDNTDYNLHILQSELDKIALYNQQKQPITLAILLKLIGQGNAQVDDFIQKLFNRQFSSALNILNQLLQQGEQPVSLVRSLNRYCELLLTGKSLSHQMPISEVPNKLLKPAQFRLKQPLIVQLNQWSVEQLLTVFYQLLHTEIQLKISPLSQELIIHKFILNLINV